MPLKYWLTAILEMTPFDRSFTASYQSAVVSIALSCTILELVDGKKYRDLEI